MANKRKYLATVQFRVYRDLMIRCWSLNVEGSSFYSPTPRRLRRQNHPNLVLLGFSSKLIVWLSSFFQNRSQKQAGRAGQGRATGQGTFSGQDFHLAVYGVYLIGTSTSPEENLFRYRAESWVLPSSGLQEAGDPARLAPSRSRGLSAAPPL